MTTATLIDARSRRLPDYRRFWIALLRRDVTTAESLVDEALRVMRPAQVYLRLLGPALSLSGAAWAEREISYQDEHFITWQTLRLMRRVRRKLITAPPSGPLALAAGIAQESHRIGLRITCDLMQAYNWRIRWLEHTDRGVMREAIAECRPQAILFSIGMPDGIEPLTRLIAEIRRAGSDALIVVGGRAIAEDPSLVRRVGADMTARNGLELVHRLRQVLPRED